MEKNREDFVTQTRMAILDRRSLAYDELYQFLVACFVRADTNQEGRIYVDMFDSLIEEAAKLPRKYGFAPSSETLFPSPTLRKSARARMFAEVDNTKQGYVTLEQWIRWSLEHIQGKLKNLPKDYLSGSSEDVTKEEFVDFIKRAVNKDTPEFRELYYFLLKTFQKGDVDRKGAIDPVAFDLMIEDAAKAPRRFGLAPRTSELFRTDRERQAKRREYFAKMDTNANGEISWNEWLEYALRHINAKVAAL